jgi:hypothetical protein
MVGLLERRGTAQFAAMGGMNTRDEVSEEQQQKTEQAPPVAAPVTLARAQSALASTPQVADLVSPFSNDSAFSAAQRMAKALAASTLVPQAYRDNLPNCLIAMELASRIGVSVLAAMQNLDIIKGKPSWSAKFLIATVNASGRFTPMRFEWSGEPGKESWACRAVAKDRNDGERCEGPWITWAMAGKEGWTKKDGSKWLTMPELMFCYRAAAFWSRIYCPEISIGFQTSEEVHDTYGESVGESMTLPPQLSPAGAKSLEAVLGVQSEAITPLIVIDQEPEAEPEQQKRAGKRDTKQSTFDPETGEVKS